MQEETETTQSIVKCAKCGFRNPSSLKFCGNCGTRIVEEEEDAEKSTIKCGKCGFQNPGNLKFCGNCGSKLEPKYRATILASKSEALALIQVTGSLYLLLSLAFNALVQATVLFSIPYAASALLGLYAGYMFYNGRITRAVKAASLAAQIIGLVSTSLLFIIGIGVRGVIGPAWVIFAINLWFYMKTRHRLE